MTSPYEKDEPMPAESTRNLFVWASGFGLGALIVLFAFMFLIGIGQVHQSSTTPAAGPAGQSAASTPPAPGPAPNPAPNTAGPAASETTGGAAAPANQNTQRTPQERQQR
jgi:hypothetical protein